MEFLLFSSLIKSTACSAKQAVLLLFGYSVFAYKLIKGVPKGSFDIVKPHFFFAEKQLAVADVYPFGGVIRSYNSYVEPDASVIFLDIPRQKIFRRIYYFLIPQNFKYLFVKPVFRGTFNKISFKIKRTLALSSDTGKRYTATTTSKTAPQTPAMILAFLLIFIPSLPPQGSFCNPQGS